jgi:hypothetical protein
LGTDWEDEGDFLSERLLYPSRSSHFLPTTDALVLFFIGVILPGTLESALAILCLIVRVSGMSHHYFLLLGGGRF